MRFEEGRVKREREGEREREAARPRAWREKAREKPNRWRQNESAPCLLLVSRRLSACLMISAAPYRKHLGNSLSQSFPALILTSYGPYKPIPIEIQQEATAQRTRVARFSLFFLRSCNPLLIIVDTRCFFFSAGGRLEERSSLSLGSTKKQDGPRRASQRPADFAAAGGR